MKLRSPLPLVVQSDTFIAFFEALGLSSCNNRHMLLAESISEGERNILIFLGD